MAKRSQASKNPPKLQGKGKGKSPWAEKYTGQDAWKGKALDLLQKTRSPHAVAVAFGVHDSYLSNTRAEDREFAADWKAVKRSFIGELKASALTRAIEGHDSVVLWQGQPVRINGKLLKERKYETALTIFLLKVLGGEKYRFEEVAQDKVQQDAHAVHAALRAIQAAVPLKP